MTVFCTRAFSCDRALSYRDAGVFVPFAAHLFVAPRAIHRSRLVDRRDLGTARGRVLNSPPPVRRQTTNDVFRAGCDSPPAVGTFGCEPASASGLAGRSADPVRCRSRRLAASDGFQKVRMREDGTARAFTGLCLPDALGRFSHVFQRGKRFMSKHRYFCLATFVAEVR